MPSLRLMLLLLLLPWGAFAVTTNSVFNYTNQLWKFTPAAQPDQAWIQPDFDDTGWSNGHSVFATHLNEALNPAAHSSGARVVTQLSTNYNGQYVVTYYYRTKFTITKDPSQATLVISNMVDDGAVFYLNGQEIRRTRMPDGLIGNATYANGGSVEVANVNDTFSISPGSILLIGENTFAVEVHQGPPVGPFQNPDSVLGLALSLISFENSPPQITSFEPNISAAPGSSVELSVDYQSADPVTFSWYFQGALIPEASNNQLVLPVVNRSHEGAYQVVLSNQWGSITSLVASLTISLPVYVPLQFEWKYHFANDPGTNWISPSFDDSAWLQGPGVFGRETAEPAASLIQTELPLTNSQGQYFITYYFRTPFLASVEPDSHMLIVSNLFDDGAVFYLNGQAVFRTNMQAGVVPHSQPAFASIGDAQFSTFGISAGLLMPGTNWFAVQIAQNSVPNSDIVFGMSAFLTNVPHSFLTITSDLPDVVIEQGTTVGLESAIEGEGAIIQWFKDGMLISGVGRRSIILSGSPAEAGDYFYVGANSINSVTSRVASVTVTPVTTPPYVYSALSSNLIWIELLFNRPMDSNGFSNVTNFLVLPTDGSPHINVTEVLMTSPTSVSIKLQSPLESGVNYQIFLQNLQDTFGNTITNSPAVVARLFESFDFKTNWKFWSHTNAPPLDWVLPEFNDSNWGGARPGFPAFSPFGVLFINRDREPETSISRAGNRISTYYRKEFFLEQISGSGVGASIMCQVQDGAAFYMNGQEFLRIRMPEGMLNFYTPATPLNGPSTEEGPFSVPSHLLLKGRNVLAVELHQDSSNFSDAWMAVRLSGAFSSYPNGPVIFNRPLTNQIVQERGMLLLRPDIIGAGTFQWYRDNEAIPGATNAMYQVNNAAKGIDDASYYVIAANSQFSATSSIANVQIIPDTIPPRLLASFASNSLQEVWLKFSEPIASAPILNKENFSITNSAGGSAMIQSAAVAGNYVVLEIDPPLTPEPWIIRMNNITDTAFAPNALHPDFSAAQIGFTYLFVPTGGEWKYISPAAPVLDWEKQEFDDSSWLAGAGIFGFDTVAMPDLIRTSLPLQNLSHYFRKEVHVVFPEELMLKYYIDDGAVFYVNGNEVHRVRMPSGEIAWNTTASGSPPQEGVFESTVNLGNVLRSGQNVLAVEVHQTGPSSDVIFAAEFFVEYNSIILSQ